MNAVSTFFFDRRRGIDTLRLRRSILGLGACLMAGAVSLAGCASQPSGSVGGLAAGAGAQDGSTAFRLQDFSWAKSPGRAAIRGGVDYQSDRVPFTCRGRDVVLLPETGWSRLRVMTLYGSADAAAVPLDVVRSRTIPAPPEYALVVRHATCDASSRFEFENLPAGRWFVITLASPAQGGASPVVMMHAVDTRQALQQVTLGRPG